MTTEKNVRRLLSAIYLTSDEEIDCSTCLDLVPTYIDRDLEPAEVAPELSSLQQHLALCLDCFEEYEVLKDLAKQEQRGELPDLADILIGLEHKRQQP